VVKKPEVLVSRTKKTEIVDAVVVNSVMRADGGGEGVKGDKSQWVGSSYRARDQNGWELATMSKKLAFQVSRGSLLFLQGVRLTIACILCSY
jgi:hypothetical protein